MRTWRAQRVSGTRRQIEADLSRSQLSVLPKIGNVLVSHNSIRANPCTISSSFALLGPFAPLRQKL